MSTTKQKLFRKSAIEEAFTDFNQGMTKKYDTLLSHVKEDTESDDNLRLLLSSLEETLCELGVEKEMLVGVLLQIPWTHRSEKVVRKYLSFTVSLISTHTYYLKACLRMIVKQFLPQVVGMSAKNPDVSDETKELHNKAFCHLHTLLKAILKIVPMAPMVLLPLLSECYPYHSRPWYAHLCYVRNLLQLSAYLPSHRPQILEMLIDRMTKHDVLAPREELQALQETDDEDDNDDEDMGIFEMDCVPSGSQPKKSAEKTHVEGHKLDMLMEEVLGHIRGTCFPDDKLDWAATRDLYRDLLRIFDRIILPTYACCHIQFIMFYICSFKDELCTGFLDYLWKKVQNPNTAPIYRQAAVAYIGSLVARGNFVPLGTVMPVLELLVSWAHKYIQETAEMNTRADVALHRTFYSVCQVIFYVIAFRQHDLMGSPKGLKFCTTLNLQTIVTCRLNPLRFCLPNVVTAFSSCVRQHQLAFCDAIIERNKRSFLPVSRSHHGDFSKFTVNNPLDSFFPFDPYMLKGSFSFIKPLFRDYTGVRPDSDDDQSDQEEEHYMDVGSPIDTDLVPGQPCLTPTSPTDLLMYGSSPGFKHI